MIDSVLVGHILVENKDSISSAPLSDSCVELPETGSCPASSISSPSSTFRTHSQTEKHVNQGKVSDNQNTPASDLKNSGTHNTLSTAQVLKRNTASKDERSSTPEVNFVVVDLSKKDTANLATGVGKRQSTPVIAANNSSIVSLVVVYNPNQEVVIRNSEWYFIYCLYFVIEFLLYLQEVLLKGSLCEMLG
jgi:hypothetical protein